MHSITLKRLIVFLFILFVTTSICFAYSVPSDTIVYVTPQGSKYHREDCSYLTTATKMTIERAERRGYTPCSRCSPDVFAGSYAASENTDKHSATASTDSKEASMSTDTSMARKVNHDMENTLLYLGIAFVLYYISAWLNYFCLQLEDQQKRPVLQHICSWVAIILGLFAFPVALLCIYLNSKKTDRLLKLKDKELEEKYRDRKKMPDYELGYDDGFSDGEEFAQKYNQKVAQDQRAAYNLVTRYAARMNMSVLEYIDWCDEQERARAQSK